ncbi:polymorphic toxin type 46 domain-containing protein [Aeromonas sp. ASNIH2]|uniref:polymorphic toxin type 46 domain-containing protein n=1 Tax=Aeromonas sp. ASNIH2 TaxID=1636607 RepID=UPI002277FC06|nr:polymorphic toxin type 46 domain-containing protein [Aeromonas sp. ASNIH2]
MVRWDNRAKGTMELKLKKQYVVNEKTKVIRSTSKAIDDTWSVRGVSQSSSGGGTQLFTTEKNIFVESIE